MRLIPTLLALVAALSCASRQLPQPTRPDCGIMNAQSGNGRALCASFDRFDDALSLSLAIDAYFERAAEELGHRRDEPVEVWLDPEWPGGPTTFEHCIAFNPSDPRLAFADLYLARELVHWHAHGTHLERNLPPVVRAGIAERIAVELVPECEEERRFLYGQLLDQARRRGALPRLISAASLDDREWRSLPDDRRRYELHALGFALVDRIGVDALRDASARGPVTPDAVLRMAGVDSDGAGL